MCVIPYLDIAYYAPRLLTDGTLSEDAIRALLSSGKGHPMPHDAPDETGLGGQILATIIDFGKRLGVLENAVEHHQTYGPRLDRLERIAEQNEGIAAQLTAMQSAVTQANKANTLYQSQIGSLDSHRKEHARQQDEQMEAMAHDLAALRTEQIGPLAAEMERLKTEQLAILVSKVDTIMAVQAAHQKREEEKKAEALRHQQQILASQQQLSTQLAAMTNTAASVGKIVVAPLVVAILGSLVIGTNSSPATRTLAVYAVGSALLLTIVVFVLRYALIARRKDRLSQRGPPYA